MSREREKVVVHVARASGVCGVCGSERVKASCALLHAAPRWPVLPRAKRDDTNVSRVLVVLAHLHVVVRKQSSAPQLGRRVAGPTTLGALHLFFVVARHVELEAVRRESRPVGGDRPAALGSQRCQRRHDPPSLQLFRTRAYRVAAPEKGKNVHPHLRRKPRDLIVGRHARNHHHCESNQPARLCWSARVPPAPHPVPTCHVYSVRAHSGRMHAACDHDVVVGVAVVRVHTRRNHFFRKCGKKA